MTSSNPMKTVIVVVVGVLVLGLIGAAVAVFLVVRSVSGGESSTLTHERATITRVSDGARVERRLTPIEDWQTDSVRVRLRTGTYSATADPDLLESGPTVAVTQVRVNGRRIAPDPDAPELSRPVEVAGRSGVTVTYVVPERHGRAAASIAEPPVEEATRAEDLTVRYPAGSRCVQVGRPLSSGESQATACDPSPHVLVSAGGDSDQLNAWVVLP